jgi:hypothetical protein
MADSFAPGQRAPASGVYRTTHKHEHIISHYVTMLYGETFPPCLECSASVRFELALSAVHINAHPAFKRD